MTIARGAAHPEIRKLQGLAKALDSSVPLPGTGTSIGLDGILGLIPGVGDAATALIGSYIILKAIQLGAPAGIVLAMIVNLLLDALIGTIPVLGDLFDFAFKAHQRNVRLLAAWADDSGLEG